MKGLQEAHAKRCVVYIGASLLRSSFAPYFAFPGNKMNGPPPGACDETDDRAETERTNRKMSLLDFDPGPLGRTPQRGRGVRTEVLLPMHPATRSRNGASRAIPVPSILVQLSRAALWLRANAKKPPLQLLVAAQAFGIPVMGNLPVDHDIDPVRKLQDHLELMFNDKNAAMRTEF